MSSFDDICSRFRLNEVTMVTIKKTKITTFSIFSCLKCHILFCNRVNISLKCQIE